MRSYGLRVGLIVAGSFLLRGSRGDAQQPATAFASAETAVRRTPGRVVEANFDWSMPDRYGLDRNGNNMIDIPNTSEYVHNVVGTCDSGGCRGRPAEFEVRFDASASQVPQLPPQVGWNRFVSYEWTVTGGSLAEPRREKSSARIWNARLPEGRYDVRLIVTTGMQRAAVVLGRQPEIQVRYADTVTQQVTVEDILIVAMGDSYASGEGNPEMVRYSLDSREYRQQIYWADDGAPVVGNSTTWWMDLLARGPKSGVQTSAATVAGQNHLRAHRSSRAPSSQVALEIERADRKTSVTYVSVAASGATGTALHYGYTGIAVEPYSQQGRMKAQITEAAELVGDRQIDALIMSIGGNDIGFSPLLVALTLHSRLLNLKIADIATALHHGRWEWLNEQIALPSMREWLAARHAFGTDAWSNPTWKTLPGLNDLPSVYRAISNKTRSEGLKIFRTYITEYPNPTGVLGDDGELYYCPEIFGQMFSGFEIDPEEQEFAVQKALVPLNDAVQSAAMQHGWVYVGGIAERFVVGHGICAGAPYEFERYPYPRPVTEPLVNAARLREPRLRWFRRAGESAYLQGPFGTRSTTTGTMHPNEFGNRAIAERILAMMELPVAIPGIGWVDPQDQIAEAVPLNIRRDRQLLRQTSVQMFRLPASRNEYLRVAVTPSRPGWFQPYIRLFNSQGAQVVATRCLTSAGDEIPCSAVARNPHVKGDTTLLEYHAREPGVYYVGVSAWPNKSYDPESGTGDAGAPSGIGFGQYSLIIGRPPGRPDNTIATANPLPADGLAAGYAIEDSLDIDMFRVEVATAGASWRFVFRGDSSSPLASLEPDRVRAFAPDRQVQGQRVAAAAARELRAPTTRAVGLLGLLNKPLRPQLRVFDFQGNKLAQGTDSLTHVFSAAGVYYVGVSSGGVDYDPRVGIAAVDCGSVIQQAGRTGCSNPAVSTGRYTLTVRR